MLDPESSSSRSNATHFITKGSGFLFSATSSKDFRFSVFTRFFLSTFEADVFEGGISVLHSGGAFLLGLLLAGDLFFGEDLAGFFLAIVFGEGFAYFSIALVVV